MTNRKGIRLSPELIKSHIAETIFEDRIIGGHRVIHCHLKMDNGFIVYGESPSTSVDPENFDLELGKKIAYDKTFSQLWNLEAYRALVEQKQRIEQAAKAGHEAVRAYTKFHSLGDGTRQQDLPWDETEECYKESRYKFVEEILFGQTINTSAVTNAIFKGVVDSFK